MMSMVFTCKRGRGLWRSVHCAQTRYHAHYEQKDLCVLFHRTGSTSSDKSRFVRSRLVRFWKDWIDLEVWQI